MTKEKMREERIGQTKYSNQGCLMKIIEYEDCHNILVEFQDEYKFIQHTGYNCFNNGEVKNPYCKNILNVACVGNTKACLNYKINGKFKPKDSYQRWVDMLKRCYKNTELKNSSYKDCEVCKEWLCYENFEKWWNDTYNKSIDVKVHLDKDILIKHNKIYSPNTCSIVPVEINEKFTKSEKARGNLPIGVHFKNNKYYSCCEGNWLGYYDNILDAFNAYKIFKEKSIKNIADKYKYCISKQVYESLYNYQVEITD